MSDEQSSVQETVQSEAGESGVSKANGPNAKAGKGFPFTVVRHVVQVLMPLLFVVPVIAAGWGLVGATTGGDTPMGTPSDLPFYGSLSSSTLFGITLVDPFAALQAIVASKSLPLTLLIGALPPLVAYGLVRGRVFCGWTCPVNLLLEIVDWLREKLGIKVQERAVPRHAKVYVALGVLVLSLLLSVPVFEVLSPISFINKGLVFGSLVGGLTLLAIVLAELFWARRVWCRSLCPLGGFYEVVGKVGLVNVKIDHDACIGCNKCKKACLCDPQILDAPVAGEDAIVRAGDCMLCGKCIESCPAKALALSVGRPRN